MTSKHGKRRSDVVGLDRLARAAKNFGIEAETQEDPRGRPDCCMIQMV